MVKVISRAILQKSASFSDRQLYEAPLIAINRCSIVLDGKPALNEVTFALRAGERWALVGPNGSGKTLLLKLLRGDMWPTPTGHESRTYCFGGEQSDQPAGYKERIAYVGPERQDRYVRYEWNHTVTQVVTTGMFDEEIPRTQPNARQRQRVASLMRQLQLWSLRNRGFLTLSYGQRRRALIARALAGEPIVLLLDEVFNGLDSVSARIVRKALGRTRGVGSTWILTTHRAQDVPATITHVARMAKGKLELAAPLQTIKRERVTKNSLRSSLSPRRAPLKPLRVKIEKDSAKPLVELRDVDLYRDYRLVLRDVNWTIARGEHWAIMGRNGSGKSTLLKLLYGDLHPRLGGEIERAGVPFGTPIAEWKQRVGFVSPELQADYFLARDIEEIVISGRYASVGLNEAATKADKTAARRWLKFFGLQRIAHRGPRTVSYGQMRLALLARAMINDPELLLLDEPCTGLDVETRAMVLKLLDRLAKCGVQLVMAVHDQTDTPDCVRHLLRIERGRAVGRESGRAGESKRIRG
jgi:molybdate transport system ATP-binding protein